MNEKPGITSEHRHSELMRFDDRSVSGASGAVGWSQCAMSSRR